MTTKTMHKLNDPTYSQVKLSVKVDLQDKNGTFSFSIIHQVTKIHINIKDSNVTNGLNFTFPNSGSLNWNHKL